MTVSVAGLRARALRTVRTANRANRMAIYYLDRQGHRWYPNERWVPGEKKRELRREEVLEAMECLENGIRHLRAAQQIMIELRRQLDE